MQIVIYKKVGIEFLFCLLITSLVFFIILHTDINRFVMHVFGDFYFGSLIIFILPLTNLISILIADKIYFKKYKLSVLGTFFILIFNLIGIILFALLYEFFVETNFPNNYLTSNFYLSFISSCLVGTFSSIAGYNLGDLITTKISHNKTHL